MLAGAKIAFDLHVSALGKRGCEFREPAEDVLGISIRVAQESYAKWTPSRQARIDHLMRAVQELGDPATAQDERWVQ